MRPACRAMVCAAGVALALCTAPVASALDAYDIGLRAAAALPFGEVRRGESMADSQSAALPIQFDGFWRQTNRLRWGLSASFARGILPTATPADTATRSATTETLRAMASVQYHTAPFASIDPWFGASLGGAWLDRDKTVETIGALVHTESRTFAPTLDLHGGVQWRLQPDVYIGPYAAVSLSQALSTQSVVTSGALVSSTSEQFSGEQRTLHVWLAVGVALNYGL